MAEQHTPAELETMLRKAVKAVPAAMLGVVGGQPHHFAPMRAYQVDEEKPYWFIIRHNAELVQELDSGAHDAMLTVVSQDHHLHACIGGVLREDRDQARIDMFWNSVTDAWLPEGKTSPEVTLLQFDPSDAVVWLSDNSFKLAFEVAKANYKGVQIDSGEKAKVKL